MTLRRLFVDMNAYFASVEQQDNPDLRGKPVAVVPVDARTTCCLAASYEAKAKGVKTGMPVWQAEQLCPGLERIVGRHERYTEVHHQIVRAVGRCIPVTNVMSIDEMACDLMGDERTPEKATAIARQIKAEIRDTVGDYLRCSIGIAPNTMLAKVAGDMQKPDGLTLIRGSDLPGRLYSLKLTDFPGIGPRMEKRFHRFGITNVRQLIGLTVKDMSNVWGSKVHGERWYFLLRGEDLASKPTRRRTVGHSHVLPPNLRTDAGAYGVMSKLVHKAAARLRSIDYWAGALGIAVRYEDGARWEVGCKLPQCQDTLNLLRAFGALWLRRPTSGEPKKVSMVLSDLVPTRGATPSLFDFDRQVTDLSHAMDRVNRTFGKHAVHFGAAYGMEDAAPTRIAFSQIPEFDPAAT
ncbi:DNA polymerase Y family protein [Fimbriiglobus ruber]|uniref:DNA polymerase IV n=1 Tax=Fimbriiglobus ruber TaxID=1908690 RepID=A0A225DWB1_9BACT|nr:DNA polymerase [Fimbriiglobus ruber]OWK40605.1 DNA polymerase IV [Fimbriiglobus ruber]